MQKYFLSLLLFALSMAATIANAGIFDLPSFIQPKQWSVGLEPEIIISQPTGAGFNFKPRYGINDILNLEGILGAGSGSHNFRMGMIADFDWFLDTKNQLGLATPFFVSYNRIQTDGVFTYGFEPLIYKTFHAQTGADYTPFFSIPLGWSLRNSKNQNFAQFAIGSMFKFQDLPHWQFTIESGFNVTNAFSYLSGGFTYYQ